MNNITKTVIVIIVEAILIALLGLIVKAIVGTTFISGVFLLFTILGMSSIIYSNYVFIKNQLNNSEDK